MKCNLIVLICIVICKTKYSPCIHLECSFSLLLCKSVASLKYILFLVVTKDIDIYLNLTNYICIHTNTCRYINMHVYFTFMLDKITAGHIKYQVILFSERVSKSPVSLSCTTRNLNYLL